MRRRWEAGRCGGKSFDFFSFFFFCTPSIHPICFHFFLSLHSIIVSIAPAVVVFIRPTPFRVRATPRVHLYHLPAHGCTHGRTHDVPLRLNHPRSPARTHATRCCITTKETDITKQRLFKTSRHATGISADRVVGDSIPHQRSCGKEAGRANQQNRRRRDGRTDALFSWRLDSRASGKGKAERRV